MISTHSMLDQTLHQLDQNKALALDELHAIGREHHANIVMLEIIRASGKREYRFGHNARTNAGANYIMTALFSSNSAPINYLALSSATLTPAAGDTVLASEITTSGLARKLATFGAYSAPAALNGSAAATLTASFTNSGSSAVAVTSVGLFTAASGGTLCFEVNLSAGNTVNPGDSVAITYAIQG